MRKLIAIAALSALTLTAAVAEAFEVVLPTTGVDDSGVRLSPGATDLHWQVVSGPGVTQPFSAVVVNNQTPGPYFQSASSRWIWAYANAGGSFNSPYVFRLSFDLTGLDPNSASISGAWSVDDFGAIRLNGATPTGTGAISLTATGPGSTFNSQHPFTITGGFVGGVNTLDFAVTNVVGPGGINVSSIAGSAAPVPEPGAAMLLFAGLMAVALKTGAMQRRAAAG